jgi:hypothetical protein
MTYNPTNVEDSTIAFYAAIHEKGYFGLTG